mgnify:CR=1 FL=1
MIGSDFFGNQDSNLYKYIIIIGLSLFLLYPLINKDLTDNKIKMIELEYEVKIEQNKLEKYGERILSTLHNFDGKEIKTYEELNKITVEMNKEIQVIQSVNIHQYKKGSKQYEEIEDRIVKIFNVMQIKYTGNLGDEEVKRSLEIYRNRISELRIDLEKLKERSSELQNNIEKNKEEKRYINKQILLGTISRVIGVILIIIGIYYWYNKIQKYYNKYYSNIK